MLKFAKTQGRSTSHCGKLYSFIVSHVAAFRGAAFRCANLSILNRRYVLLPLRDEVCADGENRRGSAIDLGAVQAAFGAVHLHSTKPKWQQPSKLLRPLLLSTQSSLGHPRRSRIEIYHSDISGNE